MAFWRAIREGHRASNTRCFKRILGRMPITLTQWASKMPTLFGVDLDYSGMLEKFN
jgi:hypothetical protein